MSELGQRCHGNPMSHVQLLDQNCENRIILFRGYENAVDIT